jgi:hypothetical protein
MSDQPAMLVRARLSSLWRICSLLLRKRRMPDG